MKQSSIYFENIIEVGSDRYLFDEVRDCLMKVEMEEMSLSPVAIVKRPSQFNGYPLSYGKIIYANNKIYAVPTIPAPIFSYSIKKHEVSYIEYDIDYTRFPGMIFSDVCMFGDYLYFIPCCYDSVVKLNTVDDSVEYISLKGYYDENSGPFFAHRGHLLLGSRLVFAVHSDNRILSIDLNSFEVDIIKELPSQEKLEGIVEHEDYIWVFPMRADKIYKLNKTDCSEICCITSFPDDYLCGDFCFSDIVKIGHSAYLLPREANMVMRLNMENGCIERVIEKPIVAAPGFYSQYCPFSCAFEYDDRVYLLEAENGVLLAFDKDWKTSSIRLKKSKMIDSLILDSRLLYEDNMIGLDEFLWFN